MLHTVRGATSYTVPLISSLINYSTKRTALNQSFIERHNEQATAAVTVVYIYIYIYI